MIRRRALLTAPLALALPASGNSGAPGTDLPYAPAVYDTLRERWLTLALGAPSSYDATAEPYAARLAHTGELARAHAATMAPTPDSLWPDDPFTGSGSVTHAHDHLWTMTRAYLQPATGSTGDPGLLATILRGLDHLSATVYHPGTTPYGNWWDWRIGAPRLLTDIAIALYDELGPARRQAVCAAVDHFIPDSVLHDYSGSSTGANRVDVCRCVALRGILGRAPDRLTLARDALSPVFPYVTAGDGLYADGSFVQHTRVPYSGTYGQVMLDGFGRLFVLLAGSPWEVTDPARHTIFDSVEHAYAPLIHDGLVVDAVNGRAISRGWVLGDDEQVIRGDHYHGHALVAAIAVLSQAATPEAHARWHGRIKGWIERDTAVPLLTSPQFEVADLARLHAIAESELPAVPEELGHRLFPAMDRAVHRGRNGFTAALSMASDRIAHYECGNGENPRGWHTGAGMLQWWAAGESGQYTDWYWPTVDWYRLPGTTVSTRRLPDRAGGEWAEPRPDVRWVGGTSDGECGVVGQHLQGLESTLQARKSWFFLPDAVVCLGAGITCADGVPVETVVDNRQLDGDPAFVRGRDWAHLEGHGGWVFLDGNAVPSLRSLRSLREDRTGAWADINTGSRTERRTRRWQTLWLDHGTDPVAASYAYVLMPGATRAQVAAADHGRLSVLANDDRRQALHVPSLGLTAANFWTAGSVGALTASAGASVLVRQTADTLTVCVSEPPRTGEPLEIVWDGPVGGVVRADETVDVRECGGRLRLRVTPGKACATSKCEVSLR